MSLQSIGYDAFAAGYMEAWAAVQADYVVWEIQVGLPYTGTYIGSEAIMTGVLGPIGDMRSNFKVEPMHFYESGDIFL